MKKKVTLTIFVLLFSSLGVTKAQPTQLKDQIIAFFGALIGRTTEAEEKPLLGKLLTKKEHKDVGPLIISEYIASAPTFIDAAKQIVPLALTSKALREASIKALANRIEREAVAERKNIQGYATDLLLEVVKSAKPVPLLAFEALMMAGANAHLQNKDGFTPLMFAAQNGQKEIVKALITAGADVRAKDVNGYTPLHAAVSSGQKEIVKALLAAGANVRAKDVNGYTPLSMAKSLGHKEIVEALLTAGASEREPAYPSYGIGE